VARPDPLARRPGLIIFLQHVLRHQFVERVVEAVLLVPHSVVAGPVHRGRNVEEVFEELDDHILRGVVLGEEFNCQLRHVLAEECHPCCTVCLLQVASGGQRCAPIENPDVVKAEETTFEHILLKPLLAEFAMLRRHGCCTCRRFDLFELGFAAGRVIHDDQSLRNQRVGSSCSSAASDPLFHAVILIRMSFGVAFAYSTKTSK
jgi:hypothetical protein